MKKVWILIVFMLLGGCSNDFEFSSHKEMPTDFDFSLKYGEHGKREINTFNNFIVKDLISNGTIQANLTLTEQEMNDIYKEMMNLDIMGELDLEKEKVCSVSPPSNSEWEIHMNNKTKKFSYQSYCEPPKNFTNLKILFMK